MVASSTVGQWLSQPRRPGFDAQALHSFLVLFHLITVVRLKILVEEEWGHRVDVEIRYPISSPFALKLIAGITYLDSAGFQRPFQYCKNKVNVVVVVVRLICVLNRFRQLRNSRTKYKPFFTRRHLWGRRRQCLSFLSASVQSQSQLQSLISVKSAV